MSGMKPCQIKASLMLAGILQQDIADTLDVDPSWVNKVVNNNSNNLRIRTEIAERLHKEISDIWPDEQYRRPSGRIIEPMRAAA